jgi:site-specific DNA recombinase
MNVEGQHNPKDIECIPVESVEVLPSGADWQSRHLESERRKAEIRDRIHKQAEQGQKTAKDYFRPAKPTPSIYDSDLKRVAVYACVSTSSEEQISSIENQTLYYTKKIAETENWNLQDIYSDERKSGTSLRKRDAFKANDARCQRPEDGFDYLRQHFTFRSELFGLHDADRSTENHAPGTSNRCVL